MNKKLLAIAVASAIVAPMVASADATLYGRVRTHLVYTDIDSVGKKGTDGYVKGHDEWDVEDQSSRLGVKGSEDLGNGLKAIYQFEFDVDSADSATINGGRLAYVGLTGGFGTLAIGRQWAPYYGSVDKTDNFDVGGMNDTYLGPLRLGNTLAYVSPDFSGFSGKLAMVFSDDTEDTGDDNLDAWNLSLDYNNGPLSVGASYLSFEGESANGGDYDQWGLAGKYKFGDMFALIAVYEDRDDNSAAVTEASEWTVQGEVYFGNNTIRASYGQLDDKATKDDEDQWRLGLKHNFSKRTSVYAEYEDSEIGTGGDHSRLGIGLRHDF